MLRPHRAFPVFGDNLRPSMFSRRFSDQSRYISIYVLFHLVAQASRVAYWHPRSLKIFSTCEIGHME